MLLKKRRTQFQVFVFERQANHRRFQAASTISWFLVKISIKRPRAKTGVRWRKVGRRRCTWIVDYATVIESGAIDDHLLDKIVGDGGVRVQKLIAASRVPSASDTIAH